MAEPDDGAVDAFGDGPAWWASENFWRKCAIFVTAAMALALVILTFHTLTVIAAGADAGQGERRGAEGGRHFSRPDSECTKLGVIPL